VVLSPLANRGACRQAYTLRHLLNARASLVQQPISPEKAHSGVSPEPLTPSFLAQNAGQDV